MDTAQLTALCEEIRAFLIENVSKTGGHLSSNLGTIELTVALHKVFSTPQDVIVWDVGHQCYTHKILTGRRDGFDKLRMKDGLSGFPMPRESEHDAFISGHGNTALSAAIGFANAKLIRGEPGKVIAVIGDGAYTGGMVYEGMNNIRVLGNLIVILNDNKMSISKNVGALAQYFTRLRSSPGYFKAKRDVQSVLEAIPVVGLPVKHALQSVKGTFRHLLYHSTMFEDMGMQYIGPVNGHNVEELCTLFRAYRDEQTAPMLLHVETVKGKGFTPAEENPGEFHGVSAFDVNHITDPDIAPDSSFSTMFGRRLALLGDEDENLCAITAAMKYGTGLQYFYKRHQNRFFDVGMAEQHAVTFAAGLAAAGMKPVVALYSTFLQRSFDQLIHDVNLQNLKMLVAIDRAGLVPGDGETHQGVYDAAFLSEMPHMRVISPCNYAELLHWLEHLLSDLQGPCALRYPRGAESEELAALGCTGAEYDVYPAQENAAAPMALVTYGAQAQDTLHAAKLLAERGIQVDVYKLCQIHPLPQGLTQALLPYKDIVFAEEGICSGGIGEHLAAALQAQRYRGGYHHIGVDAARLTHASVAELRELFGLDAVSIANTAQALINEGTL